MQAVIFDLDGTLLDSRERVFWQFEELTKHYDGAAASRREIATQMHGTSDQVIRSLVKNSTTPFNEIRQKHDDLYENSLHQLRLYPGVSDLLPILRRLGKRLAAVTSDDNRVLAGLDRLGIRHYFDIIITADHITNPRPHPESLEHVLTFMALAPSEVAMVGDSVGDIMAAKRAHLAKSIAVSHGVTAAHDLRAAGPDHVIDDIPSLLGVLEARIGL